jgi:hypothetical protein
LISSVIVIDPPLLQASARKRLPPSLLMSAENRSGDRARAVPDRACSSQRQKAIGLGRPGEAAENIDLGVLIEIDQNVSAEDHIEDPELGKIVQQIQLPVRNHRPNICIDLPELADLLEVFYQQLNRQTALNFELAV